MTLPLTSLTLVSGLPKQSVLGGVELGMCFLGEGGIFGQPRHLLYFICCIAGWPSWRMGGHMWSGAGEAQIRGIARIYGACPSTWGTNGGSHERRV